MQPMTSSVDPSNGGRLVETRGRTLPLIGAALEARAAGGLARLVLRQHFRNTHAEPLAVTYSLPLPSDAAVSGFAFVVGDRRIVGEVDRRASARQRFEQAILEGHTAALLEQERTSLFTQEIGNIPPNTDVDAEVVLDLRLRWLDEGAWELRFPTTAAPRYLGEPGRVEDASRVTQDVADGPVAARLVLSVDIQDQVAHEARPSSPSHAAVVTQSGAGWHVGLGEEGVSLDRDVVVRWPVASLQPGATLSTARPASALGEHDAYGLLTIVPPLRSAKVPAIPRDLIVLLDTSGSMSGEPLAQAVRVASALIDTLGERDTVALMAFASSVQRWRRQPVAATRDNKQAALGWLGALRASGGTEMREGILAALEPLRGEAQRQVVLVTDGLIGFEQQIVRAIATQRPAGSRVHTVGVGAAVNRALTAGAARAGRGIEVIVGLGEDAEPAARRLVARTDRPLITELTLQGSALRAHSPDGLPDLFAGAPVVIGLDLRPEGGELTVRGQSANGPWEQRLMVDPVERGSGDDCTARLVARERVEDLEAHLAAGESPAAIDARIEDIGVRFQIATRLTSWVAIDPAVSVDPSSPIRRETMPHQLPQGMSVAGLGLRAAMVAPQRVLAFRAPSPVFAAALPVPRGASGIMDRAARSIGAFVGGVAKGRKQTLAARRAAPPAEGAERPVQKAMGTGASEQRADKEIAHGRIEERSESSSGSLRGRIVRRTRTSITIEVVIETAGFTWDPQELIRVELADDTDVTARLGKGTRPGPIPQGASIRIVLELDREVDTSAALLAIHLDQTSGPLIIEL